jgi:hypothetical protein
MSRWRDEISLMALRSWLLNNGLSSACGGSYDYCRLRSFGAAYSTGSRARPAGSSLPT